MAVLAATMGRHIFMDRGYYTIFPNLYVVLVAGSAKCRKSVSSHLGMEILGSITNPPMVFSQKITNEALIGALLDSKVDGKSCGIIYASELSVFMGGDAVGSGLIPTLTDLYDSPSRWCYHTKSRGVEVLENVSLCMLGASTMDWLRNSIPVDAVGGGFTSRVIFIYQDKPRKAILFPHKSEAMNALHKDLVSDLNHIRAQRGPMDLTLEARDLATKWYGQELGKSHDSKLEGYFGRKHDTMFKLAMILSLAESDERWITPDNVKKALELLTSNEANLSGIMASVTSSEEGDKTDKVLAFIRKVGKITHTELMRQCWRMGNAIEVAENIRTLVEAGEIKPVLGEDNRTRYYEAASRI